MRSFITGLIVVVVLLAAAIGIAPYFIGQKVEANFKQEIAMTNNQSPYAKLSISHYQRGWFSANADVTVSITPGQASSKPLSFDVPVTVKHGPVMMLPAGLKFGLGAFLINQQTSQFNGTIGSLISFSGNASPFGKIGQVSFDKDGLKFSLQNLTLTHSSNQLRLNIEKMSVQTPASDKTKPILISFNQLKFNTMGSTNDAIKEWLGSAKLSLDSIHATEVGGDKDKQDVTMRQLMLAYTSELTNNNSKNNVTINFNIQSIQVGDDKTIKPVTLSYGLYGMDANAIRAINEMTENNPQVTQQPAKLMPSVFNMLSKGLSLKINKMMIGLSKSIASSDISLTADATLKPNGVNKQVAQMSKAMEFAQADTKLYLMPLLSLTKYLDVSVNASLPKSLVKAILESRYKDALSRAAANNQSVAETPDSMATKAFQYLTDNKMLLPGNQAGAVQVQLTFKDGKLLVNGQAPALDLPQPNGTHTSHTMPEAAGLSMTDKPSADTTPSDKQPTMMPAQ